MHRNLAPLAVGACAAEVDGIGAAITVVRVTHDVPIPGAPCNDVAGIRWITLDNGTGTLVSTFGGTRCPLGRGGKAFRVDFDWSTILTRAADPSRTLPGAASASTPTAPAATRL